MDNVTPQCQRFNGSDGDDRRGRASNRRGSGTQRRIDPRGTFNQAPQADEWVDSMASRCWPPAPSPGPERALPRMRCTRPSAGRALREWHKGHDYTRATNRQSLLLGGTGPSVERYADRTIRSTLVARSASGPATSQAPRPSVSPCRYRSGGIGRSAAASAPRRTPSGGRSGAGVLSQVDACLGRPRDPNEQEIVDVAALGVLDGLRPSRQNGPDTET